MAVPTRAGFSEKKIKTLDHLPVTKLIQKIFNFLTPTRAMLYLLEILFTPQFLVENVGFKEKI